MNRPEMGYDGVMKYVFIRALSVVAAVAILALPQVTLADNTFYGITIHVSSTSIKVHNPKTQQTLSFEIVPKFDQVFSADGKSTYQMSSIKAGQYVGIIYDQKALGIRHADKIYLLNNANQTIGTQYPLAERQ
jgi:hypothetical protein